MADNPQVLECEMLINARSMQTGPVYVKVWRPAQLKIQTQVLVFLHGRASSVRPGEKKRISMIEGLGLKEWMKSAAYKANPTIILAPQDTFKQRDGGQAGSDYWEKVDGRDWQTFLKTDLREYILSRWKILNQPWLIAGVSMGAHGAIKMAIEAPQQYAAFAALSPVFRSIPKEIPAGDRDVFYGSQGQQNLIDTSIGTQILDETGVMREIENTPHWIEIHQNDFALKAKEFPAAPIVWQKLLDLPKGNGLIEINTDPSVNVGHSVEYWHKRLPQIFDWLLRQPKRLEQIAAAKAKTQEL